MYLPTWVINWENKFQSEDKTRSAKVRFQWCSCLLWTFEHYAWAFNLNYHPIGNLGFKPCHFAVVVVERQTKGRVLDLQTRLGPHALDLLYYPLNDLLGIYLVVEASDAYHKCFRVINTFLRSNYVDDIYFVNYHQQSTLDRC